MALRLPGKWAWDFWLAKDGTSHHMFFLHAPKSLGDQLARHFAVTIGHAVSDDLHEWRILPDALRPSPQPAFDDLATWTGSVIQAPNGRWLMFYTGVCRAERGDVQRIGVAWSDDLCTWQRQPHPVLEADPRWYEPHAAGAWHHEAWRDPYVFADPTGDGWHMLITARANHGPADRRGVIGHARSHDLAHWEVQPPLTEPGAFGHLEVPQVEIVDSQPLLIFSTGPDGIPADRREEAGDGGVWTVPGASLYGPFDTGAAKLFPDTSLFSGRLVRDGRGRWNLIGFHNLVANTFIGEISDPIPVAVDSGYLVPARDIRQQAGQARSVSDGTGPFRDGKSARRR